MAGSRTLPPRCRFAASAGAGSLPAPAPRKSRRLRLSQTTDAFIDFENAVLCDLCAYRDGRMTSDALGFFYDIPRKTAVLFGQGNNTAVFRSLRVYNRALNAGEIGSALVEDLNQIFQ